MNEKTTTAISEYSPTAAALADIANRMAKVVYDVSTPAGMEAAKKDRAEVKALRVALEHKRKEIKAPALKRCSEIDTEANRITAELLKYEEPPDRAIKAEEQRIDRERLAKIAAEEQRTAAIRLRIKVMEDLVIRAHMFKTAAEVEHAIEHVRGVDIDKGFDELRDAAAIAKEDSLRKLIEIHVILKEREAEAARLAAERAELDRQRAAQAAADKARRDNEEAERKRKADIQERIAELRGNQHLTASNGTKLIGEHLQDLEKLPTDAAIFGEFVQQAVDAKTAGMLRLSALWKAAKDHEDEQARAAAQRAENARIAAEQAAAQKVIDDQRRELETRQQAERDAQAKKEREEREAEDRRVAAEQEQRNKERMAEEEQQRKNFKPEAEAIVHVLCTTYQRDAATVEGWLRGYFGAAKARKVA